MCCFGVPHELHSNHGRNFESQIFQEICERMGVTKTRTTPFNLKSDGLVERTNRTIVQILAKLLDPERNQKDWDERIPYALLAYRSAVHQSTGETPNLMMLGREVELPLDLMIEAVPQNGDSETAYVEALRQRMHEAWDRARVILKLSARRQKRYYDRNLHSYKVAEGDPVWYLISGRKKGVSRKLQEKWDGPYKVLNRLSDVTLRIKKYRGKPRVVHIDKLKPFMGDLPVYWNSLSGVQVEAVVESDDSDYTEGQVQLPPGSRSPQGPSESNQVRARRKPTYLNEYILH